MGDGPPFELEGLLDRPPAWAGSLFLVPLDGPWGVHRGVGDSGERRDERHTRVGHMRAVPCLGMRFPPGGQGRSREGPLSSSWLSPDEQSPRCPLLHKASQSIPEALCPWASR